MKILLPIRLMQSEFASIYVAPSSFGRGLFAGRNFDLGEVISQFSGPIITLREAILKGELEGNALQIGPRTYLDLEPPGVFINHSCEPNTGLNGQTTVRALRHIRAGEEIYFDYSTTMSEQRWTMACLCGTPSCRGVIGDFHDLPEELQRHYLRLGIVQPFIVAEREVRQAR